MSNWEDYNKAFLTDSVRFLLGELLGEGISREVYVYAGNPDWVVKVEVHATSRFQNVMEYNFYQEIRWQKDLVKWIAPCERISPHGNWLLQRRTMPVTLAELKRAHPRVPVWLTDTKVGNWGRNAKGRIVCHDYGTHNAAGCMSKAMKKAGWWEE